MNNVFVAFELMQYLDHKRDGKDSFMAVKLDMSVETKKKCAIKSVIGTYTYTMLTKKKGRPREAKKPPNLPLPIRKD